MAHLIFAADSHYRGGDGNSTSSGTYRRFATELQALWRGQKALTLQHLPSIRAPMAAGAIPPPLFFERRRQLGCWPGNGILGNTF